MSSLTVLIIRHAEKPSESSPCPGITADGVLDDKSLVVRGWQRAGAWSALFAGGLNVQDYPPPAIIYAADPNAKTSDPPDPAGQIDDQPSRRPFETVTALAARLFQEPKTIYALGQEKKLVETIVSQTGVVLVAWEHKAIARSILPAIANGQVLPNMPTKWDGARFDVVLRFDRIFPAAPWSFRQLFPCLLSGDSAAPMR
jgi:hypothetical protein